MSFLCDQLEKAVRRLILMFVIHEDVNKAKFAGDLALAKFNKTKHQLPAASVKLLTTTSSALQHQHQLMLIKLTRLSSRQSVNNYWSLYLKSL